MHAFRIAGHPIHPAVVHFPIAAWTAALLGDVGYIFDGDLFWWKFAYWAIAAGVVTGLFAMLAGFLELASIGATHAAWPLVNLHMALMGGSWIVFVVNLVLRNAQTPAPTPLLWLLMSLSAVGMTLLVLGGQRGASLVYDHGVGGRMAEKE